MNLIQAIVNNAPLLEAGEPSGAALARQKRIEALLPSGSGFDNGTRLLRASDTCVEFETAFHHMNEHGYYTGWTDHKVIVSPSLLYEFTIRVSGVNRNGIKDYIADVFATLLKEEFKWMET